MYPYRVAAVAAAVAAAAPVDAAAAQNVHLTKQQCALSLDGEQLNRHPRRQQPLAEKPCSEHQRHLFDGLTDVSFEEQGQGRPTLIH